MHHDYTTVTTESVRAAVDDAIERGEELVATVVGVSEAKTWANTMAPLNVLDDVVVRANGTGPFMARVHPEREVRDAAQEAEEKLSKWTSDLVFRRDLYDAIEGYASTDEAAALEGERARYLEFNRRDLRRAGHALSEEERAEVQKHRTRLVELGVAFNRNIDEASGGLDLTREQLDGMPDDYVHRLAEGEADGTHRVSIDYPDYYPFMDMATDRDLRRRLQFIFYNKAVEENEPILEEAVRLRHRIAEIFGLPSWADYAMEVKMADGPEAVEEMYAGIVPGLTEKAQSEVADLASAMDGEGAAQPWDHRYLHTSIKRERFGIDPLEVAVYFPLQQVLDGMFEITEEVFGLTYRPIDDPRAWHPDVLAYEVHDAASSDQLATFYMDLFPREGKFGHAAAFDLVPAHAADDGYVLPVTSIVANFTKPTNDIPSLLRHDEVVTLFHEFGHVLHNSLGHTELVRFSGFNTEWDFVEAPSQIMEHWCWNADVLSRFARHHESGEPIPEDLVGQLVAARDLHIALANLRQVSFGKLDMAFHGPGHEKDLRAIDRETTELAQFPFHEDTYYPAGFGHLFGYDAGYYGYLWSKVFGDDMFSRFEEEGVLSPDVGTDYRNKILGPGGSKDPVEMLEEFLGREPNQEAFLRFLGIG
ncbi:MAG: M3 family metallopeptidase [Acidimicrobiia bacterium]